MIEHIAEIKRLSHSDFLTNLYNRRYFFELGKKFFSSAKRRNTNFSVAMIDIDHFKSVNDTYGHDAGDEVLKNVAQILKNRFRESDIVSRFGGEEFCIFAADLTRNDSIRVFEEIRNSVEQSYMTIGGESVGVTISIGVCTVPEDTLDDMIKQSDLMLYEAKRMGRNRLVCE